MVLFSLGIPTVLYLENTYIYVYLILVYIFLTLFILKYSVLKSKSNNECFIWLLNIVYIATLKKLKNPKSIHTKCKT